jgi:hypothetical protein
MLDATQSDIPTTSYNKSNREHQYLRNSTKHFVSVTTRNRRGTPQVLPPNQLYDV